MSAYEIAGSTMAAVETASVGAVTATSRGTTLTANASANTKGTYVELTSSSPIDADGFLLTATVPTVAIDHMIDIAVGAASSEVVVLANFAFELFFEAGAPSVFIPVPIPAGSRISARVQGSTGSATIDVSLILVKGGFAGVMQVGTATTYGADTATSTGTNIPYSGSTNTKNTTWTELSASTTGHTRALLILVGLRGAVNANGTSSLLDIGVGAASSEVAVVPNLAVQSDSTTDRFFPLARLVPADIPAGSRLSARAQHSGNVTYDIIVIGFS